MHVWVSNSQLPKWLKVVIYTLLTITLVYWLGYAIYKILETTRKVLHWATECRNWWTFLICILILGVGSLLMAQYYFDLDPLGKLAAWAVLQWDNLRNAIASKIINL